MTLADWHAQGHSPATARKLIAEPQTTIEVIDRP